MSKNHFVWYEFYILYCFILFHSLTYTFSYVTLTFFNGDASSFMQVISKSCRETHCHFCLNELPPDSVPCPSCSVPVYCSESCQIQSGGMLSTNEMDKNSIFHNLPDDIVDHIKGVTSAVRYYSETECVQEHQHECRGANWPAVLPSDAVLAGRVIMKLINQGETAMDLSNLHEKLVCPLIVESFS